MDPDKEHAIVEQCLELVPEALEPLDSRQLHGRQPDTRILVAERTTDERLQTGRRQAAKRLEGRQTRTSGTGFCHRRKGGERIRVAEAGTSHESIQRRQLGRSLGAASV